jgi:hypothetical protein
MKARDRSPAPWERQKNQSLKKSPPLASFGRCPLKPEPQAFVAENACWPGRAPAMTSDRLWFFFSVVWIVVLITAMVYVAFG